MTTGVRLVAALTILILFIATFAFKTLSAPSTPSRHSDGISSRSSVAGTAQWGIVPAPVIDHSARLFVGTGDASNGSWVASIDNK
jgi:hypothetical protein